MRRSIAALAAAGVLWIGASGAAAAACARSSDANYAAMVEGIQRELTIHGFYAGPFDGQMGSRTQSGIRAYQKAAGLPVTGCPSEELINHISFTQPPVFARRRPQQMSLEAEVQQKLSDLGYYSGPVDGRMGPLTARGIRSFQQANGMPVDGMPSPELLDRMRDAAPRINTR